MAVVPAEIAMSTACRAKNMRCPVVTAAIAEAPSSPTILILIIPMIENSKLLRIAGHASAQMPRRGLSASGNAPDSGSVESFISVGPETAGARCAA